MKREKAIVARKRRSGVYYFTGKEGGKRTIELRQQFDCDWSERLGDMKQSTINLGLKFSVGIARSSARAVPK